VQRVCLFELPLHGQDGGVRGSCNVGDALDANIDPDLLLHLLEMMFAGGGCCCWCCGCVIVSIVLYSPLTFAPKHRNV
jgi:hypothetical protein